MTEINQPSGPLPEGLQPLPENAILAEVAKRVLTRYPGVQELQDESPQGTEPKEGEQ